jgi:transcriptional regulator with XRE-family HTH domain
VETLPDQEELRRRMKAGRALRDVTVAQLAELIPPEAKLSEKTLYKLEGGQTQITLPILREIAVRLGLPITWFTVPDLPSALAPSRAADERVAALEAEMARVWQAMRRPGEGIRPVSPGS